MLGRKRKPWSGRQPELLLIAAVADRELEDASNRDASMRARASILIGAASVVGAIQLGTEFNFFLIGSLLLSLAAAVCGVIVVFPRTSGAFNPRTMWNEIYAGAPIDEALHHMVRVKLKWLDSEDASLGRRSNWARAGFVLLTVSIVLAAAGTIFPDGLAEILRCLCPNPSSSPTP